MPSKAELVCVAPSHVEQIWPLAKEFIRSALERTGLSRFEECEAAILSGKHLLWLAWNGRSIEAAASTQMHDGVCTIVACGGHDRTRWLPLIEQIEDYARQSGCRCTRIIGRKGWMRALSDYKARFVILERAL